MGDAADVPACTVTRGWRQNGWTAGSVLVVEDVERRGRDLSGVERRQQVRVDQVAVASGV